MTDTTTRAIAHAGPTETSAGPWTPSDRERKRRRTRRWRSAGRVLVVVVATVVVLGAIGVGIALSPGWPRVREMFLDLETARDALPALAEGLWLDARIVLVAAPAAVVLGLAIALLRETRSALLVPLRGIAAVGTDLLRSVPTLLLVLVCAFGIPALDLRWAPESVFLWASVALAVAHAASVAAVLRTAFATVPPAQLTIADALALSRGQAFRHVVLPQGLRHAVPALLADLVALLKDTALVATVALADALLVARDRADDGGDYTPYVVVALFFVAVTLPFVLLGDRMANRQVRS